MPQLWLKRGIMSNSGLIFFYFFTILPRFS